MLQFQKLFDISPLLPSSGMTEVANVEVPKFDGRAGSSANYEEKVNLRKRIPAMDPAEKAAHLLLHTSDVARKVCSSVGEDAIGNLGGAGRISKIPRDRFARDAIDSIFQGMAKFMYFKRAY